MSCPLLLAAPVIFLRLWSVGIAIAKIGLQHARPFTLQALRYTITVLVLLPLIPFLKPQFPTGRAAWDIAVTRFLIQVAYFGLCYIAFKSGVPAGALRPRGCGADWTPELFATLAYLMIGNSLISITLLLAIIRAGEFARVSALFYLVPPLSALFAGPLLGEAMPPLAWAGMVLAGIGVTLARR